MLRPYKLGIALVLGLGLAVAGCASKKASETESVDALPQPSAEAGTDPLPPPGELNEAPPAADPSASLPPSQESAAIGAMAQDPKAEPPAGAQPPAAAASPPVAETASAPRGGAGEYTVRTGDTLMKIAFETYGDLFKWKEILEANRDRIMDPNRLGAGTVLKLEAPASPVQIERNGTPYLIKRGDTLGTISNDVYGTQAQWKKLWENNRQLIKDPNRIYAGFYLYYQPGGVTASPQKMTQGEAPADQRAPAAAPGSALAASPPPPAQ